MNGFLPVTKEEMIALGWDSPILFMFPVTHMWIILALVQLIITRVLASQGFRVCMRGRKLGNWKNTCDFMRFGRPKYGFLLSSAILILWLLITP